MTQSNQQDSPDRHGSSYAPINTGGALPPGFTAESAVRAYRSMAAHLKPKRVVQWLGVRPLGPADVQRQLRALLDAPRHRVSPHAKVPPLHLVLYHAARGTESGRLVYERVIMPSERDHGGRSFLDPESFARCVSGERKLFSGDDSEESEHRLGALAEFALAFGLLQPADAGALVAAAATAGEWVAEYFGLPSSENLASESVRSTDMNTSEMHETATGLRLAFESAATLARSVAQSLSVGNLEPTAWGALEVSLRSLREQCSSVFTTVGHEFASLSELEALVESRTTASLLEAARARLDDLRAIEHRDGEAHTVTGRVREVLAEAESRLAQSPELLAAIASGSHGTCALVSLVEGLDSLDDEAMDALKSEVSDVFGSDVARAASRGLMVGAPRMARAGVDGEHRLAVLSPVGGAATSSDDASQAGRPLSDTEALPISVSEPAPDLGAGDQQASPGDVAPTQPTDESDPPSSNAQSADASAADPDVLETVVPTLVDAFTPPPSQVAAETISAGPDTTPSRGDELPEEADEESVASGSGLAPADLYRTVWSLIQHGRISLAWHICAGLEAQGSTGAGGVPADILEVLLLSPHVRSSAGPLMEELRPVLERMVETLPELRAQEGDTPIALQLLLLAALVRPSLLASHGEAPTIFGQILVGGGATRMLQAAVQQFSRAHAEVTPSLLKGLRDLTAWEAGIAQHSLHCQQWLEQNRQASIIYAPTTNVWRHWLRNTSSLGHALELVAGGRVTEASTVRAAISEWSAPGFADNALARTDSELRERMARMRPIEARARTAILARVDASIRLLREWVSILDAKPTAVVPDVQRAVELLRQTVRPLLPTVREEWVGLASRLEGQAVSAAVAAAVERTLLDVEHLFDPSSVDRPPMTNSDLLRSRDLLGIKALRLSEHLLPRAGYTDEVMVLLASAATAAPLSLAGLFETQFDEGNHKATAILLDAMDAASEPADVNQLRGRRERDLARRLGQLKGQAKVVATELGRAASYDLLSQREHLDYKAKLDGVIASVGSRDQVVDCTEQVDILGEIRQAIADKTRLRSEDVRRRMANVEGMDAETRRRIEKTLDDGDFLAANEYIDLCLAGRPIPEPALGGVLESYFPQFVKQALSTLTGGRQGRGISASELINSVRNQRSVPPLEMTGVRGAQAKEAADMLQAWFGAKNEMGRLTSQLEMLFKCVGFADVAVDGPPIPDSDRRWKGELKVRTIADKDICVIPQFGSVCRGRYRVVGLWGRPTEEEILSVTAGDAGHMATIVLYFGSMTEQSRRDIAILCRARRRSLLLVDESLVLFLCGARGLRLPLLFQALLPFTVADPYVTTAGLLPPEMFFGRASERESIISALGTNLLYGGRQLGKTALLRHVEREFHRPEDGMIVVWLDLRAEQIGVSRPIGDVWTVIAQYLHLHGLQTASCRTSDDVTTAVVRWLDADDKRRVVILLDEADAFLDSDGKGEFVHVGHIKKLMDITNRRFKVVFAGLHNVQRASRSVNTPLAHLGQPICIGPLLNAKEAVEALALITKPLGDLGYRFASPDLPMRILSHTNYYPSLIQIYCKHLLEHLVDPSAPQFDLRESPPYVITERHLDAVQNDELRSKILDKFRLTLDLDPRYRLIALCIALAHAQRHDIRLDIDGVEPSWVRDEALGWWAAGFEYDNSLEAFRNILDEMIGLGILRRVGSRRYALRSPNLANLLGSGPEIEEQLLDAAHREPPVPYEQGDFRRRFSTDTSLRSPLTAQQEAVVFEDGPGVCVIAGTRLSGVQYIVPSLDAASSGGAEVITGVTDGPALIRALASQFRRAHTGVRTAVVSHETRWNDRWVDRALQWVEQRPERQGTVRLVFVADGSLAWSWAASARRQQLLDRGVREITLRPWVDPAVRLWVDDIELGLDDVRRRQVAGVTGNWTSPLGDFARRCREDSHRWKDHLDATGSALEQEPGWKQAFELPSQVAKVFRCLAEMDAPVDTSDVIELVAASTEEVSRAVDWGTLCGYVSSDASGRWRLDPVVARQYTAGV